MKTKFDWKSRLNADPVPWLLEPDNPSVRYFTLVDLLGKTETNPEVKQAKQSIMTTGIVPRVLGKQDKEGYWGRPEEYYVRSKYSGTVWNIITLAHLGVDAADNRVRAAGEFILKYSQDRESGAFAVRGGEKGGGKQVIPCLTGNMVHALIRFGFLSDPRVQKAIDWITHYLRFDDGDSSPPHVFPYENERCWGKHTCMMGVVKPLKALAEIPPARRSHDMKRTMKNGAEYLLKHHIYKRSHNPEKVAKPVWTQFGFPLMWNTDALEMLGILLKLGYHDPRMQDAIDLVLSKQNERGQWLLETTYNSRMLARIETKGEPGKWVTLQALTALKTWMK